MDTIFEKILPFGISKKLEIVIIKIAKVANHPILIEVSDCILARLRNSEICEIYYCLNGRCLILDSVGFISQLLEAFYFLSNLMST